MPYAPTCVGPHSDAARSGRPISRRGAPGWPGVGRAGARADLRLPEPALVLRASPAAPAGPPRGAPPTSTPTKTRYAVATRTGSSSAESHPLGDHPHAHLHRGLPGPVHLGVRVHQVAHPDRLGEDDLVDRGGDRGAAAVPRRGRPATSSTNFISTPPCTVPYRLTSTAVMIRLSVTREYDVAGCARAGHGGEVLPMRHLGTGTVRGCDISGASSPGWWWRPSPGRQPGQDGSWSHGADRPACWLAVRASPLAPLRRARRLTMVRRAAAGILATAMPVGARRGARPSRPGSARLASAGADCWSAGGRHARDRLPRPLAPRGPLAVRSPPLEVRADARVGSRRPAAASATRRPRPVRHSRHGGSAMALLAARAAGQSYAAPTGPPAARDLGAAATPRRRTHRLGRTTRPRPGDPPPPG